MGWSRVSRLGHRRAQRKPRSGHGEKTATRLRLRRTPPRWHVGPLASRADSNGSAGTPALTHTQDSPHGAHCGHAPTLPVGMRVGCSCGPDVPLAPAPDEPQRAIYQKPLGQGENQTPWSPVRPGSRVDLWRNTSFCQVGGQRQEKSVCKQHSFS